VSDDATTVPVTIDVVEVTPTRGAGQLVAVASVVLAIHGIEIELRGCQIRIERGRYCARGPAWKDPKTGEWRDAVLLPPELSHAFGREMVAAIEGRAAR
jgi:hypothetical protein